MLLTFVLFLFCRSTNNAAIYRKVLSNDGELESLNDKRASLILLLNGLITIIDNICLRILSLKDLQLLEEIVTFTQGIYLLVSRIVWDYCNESVSEMNKKPGQFYPSIVQARQMEIFSTLCDMDIMLRKLKKINYFHTCNKVYVMNHFMRPLKPSLTFLEKFLVKNPHFHVVMLPPQEATLVYSNILLALRIIYKGIHILLI